MTTQFRALIQNLSEGGVQFIVVGGVAASAHGSPRVTNDLDIVYRRTAENIAKLARVFSSLQPYPRGAPDGLPFRWDEKTLRLGLNFTLRTSLGYIDLLGEITGGGGYEALLDHAVEITVHGHRCLCLDLPKLIAVKRAAGRPKDFDAIADLEAIREESEKRDGL